MVVHRPECYCDSLVRSIPCQCQSAGHRGQVICQTFHPPPSRGRPHSRVYNEGPGENSSARRLSTRRPYHPSIDDRLANASSFTPNRNKVMHIHSVPVFCNPQHLQTDVYISDKGQLRSHFNISILVLWTPSRLVCRPSVLLIASPRPHGVRTCSLCYCFSAGRIRCASGPFV